MTRGVTALLCAGLAVATVAAFLGSLLTGPAGLGAGSILHGLVSGGDDAAALIAREVRLPRALLGLMIGATLGACGAALQGFLRNPLAEPGLIGISASAALGAVVALYFGFAAALPLALPLGGLAGAGLCILLIFALAGRAAGTMTLILAGIAVSSLAGALTALALSLAPSPYAALEIVFWMLGALTDRSLSHVWLAAPFLLAGLALVLSVGRGLDALTLGDDAAESLGIRVAGLRWRIVVGTAFGIGAATAVAGIIGFVGLVVPHMLRPLVGHRPAPLLFASALGGALLTLLADIAVRLVLPGQEMKLGVLTALIGAPFFLWLVLHVRERGS